MTVGSVDENSSAEIDQTDILGLRAENARLHALMESQQQDQLAVIKCPVCLSFYGLNDAGLSQSCGHVLCIYCATTGSLTKCPICRHDTEKYIPIRYV